MVERSCVNVSGLSSGASFAPGHDGYQRALALVSGKARFGRLGHQISNAPADVVPSLGSVSQTSAGSSGCWASDVSCAFRRRAVALRSDAHLRARSRRCAPACWRARRQGHCGACALPPLGAKAIVPTAAKTDASFQRGRLLLLEKLSAWASSAEKVRATDAEPRGRRRRPGRWDGRQPGRRP